MGIHGPLPQSNNVRQLRGNPGKRKTKPTPKAVPAIPNPPLALSKEGKAEWRRITPELHRLQLLALIDRAVLTLYCKMWSRWVELDRQLDKEGTTLTKKAIDKKTDEIVILEQYRHPAFEPWRACAVMVANLAKEIGASPNARLRMVLPKAKVDEGGGLD